MIHAPGYVLQSQDSNHAAERAQFEHWAAMTDAEKARLVRDLVRRVAVLQERDLRSLHPEADDREIALRAAARRLGAATVRRLTGFDADAR